MPGIPLISHSRPDSVFAYRGGQPITAATFIDDVRGLAQRLPDRSYMLNLCADRYRFAVGFCAALLRGQVSLLPPSYARDFVERLALHYAGTYCLTDGAADAGVEIVRFPDLTQERTAQFDVPRIPAAQRAALVFTSGSTGQPMAHEKTWGGLSADGSAEAELLGIAQDSGLALLGTVPVQHMYGLESTMLIAMHNGLALVAEKPFYPADICGCLRELAVPRCLVTTPVHLRTLLDEVSDLPAVDFVLCATAPLSAELAAEAESRFGAPLREIYGCTEAGQVAGRRTTQGAAWRLMRGVRLRQDERGTWALGGHVEIEAPLSDVIELNADGTFLLHGRSTDMVNIAGKRTSLAALNHHLNSIEGVRDGVFMLPDEAGKEVTRPIAFVVAPGLDSAGVMQALRARVDPVFLPRPLYLVDELPRNATGKLTRASLLQLMQRCAGKLRVPA